MKLHEFFKTGVVDPLGYSPTSGSIKPVHVANGLCRATLGEYYDPVLLNRMVNRWAKHGSEERHPTEDLVADTNDKLGDLGQPANRHRLNELRELLRGVLGADGAVFDRNENCSYTLTHCTHVTRDHNDRGTGTFLYHLLVTDLGNGESPVLQLLRDLLKDSSDELSVLSFPLVSEEKPVAFTVYEDSICDALKSKADAKGTKIFRSPIARELRKSFDTLALFERARGSKLHSLRRTVTFCGFSLFLHLANRSLDYEDGRSSKPSRPPLLLDFLQGGWSAIAIASHATYNLACKSIERMIVHGVREALAAEHGERWTTRQAEEFIAEVELRGGPKAQERKRKHFLEVFRSYSGGLGIAEAFALAAVDALLDDMSGTPFDFARGLGVRGGLLAPRGQRAVKKRYAPSPELLEVLLASTIGTDEELELEELAERWWERYGILTGARQTDARDLAQWSILDATKEDLVANADALRETLVATGYARRYADGVTMIRVGGEPR
jgi:hypothetical protein